MHTYAEWSFSKIDPSSKAIRAEFLQHNPAPPPVSSLSPLISGHDFDRQVAVFDQVIMRRVTQVQMINLKTVEVSKQILESSPVEVNWQMQVLEI